MRRLAQNRRVPVAAPSYLAARGAPERIEDLAQHDCIVLRENDRDYGLTTVAVRGGPSRAEHVVWSPRGLSPAAAAFLALLDVPA